jgi:glycosyltransferase involved in cell wall biosynthesis
MRIFFDHQVFSLHDAGGFARYYFELANHLLGTDGVTIEMAIGLHSSIYPLSTLAREGSRVYQLRTRMRSGIPRYVANELFVNAVAMTRGRFDIYHPTYYRALPLVRRRRLVVTDHDCIHEIFPELFRNPKAVIESKKRIYSAADAIICISQSSLQDLLHYYSVDPSRTHVVHHGFTTFAECPAEDDMRASKEAPYILYVGARGGHKNFVALLEAYAASGLSRGYALVAIGGGSFTNAESGRIRSLGLDDRVRLITQASDCSLARRYRNASLFVYPSLYEGFGFPPLEAMNLGCPVLTSNTSSLPEVCGDAAFYFDPKVPGTLEAALRNTLLDRERIAEKVAKGHRQSARFSWERAAKQTLEVYRAVLSR